MDFKDFWPLVATRGRVAHFYQSECEHLWSTFSPAQQQAIYDAINEKLMAGKFVHYNPANAIRDNAPKAPKTLIISAEEYYRRYGTQTNHDGWVRTFLPEQQKTIYIKKIKTMAQVIEVKTARGAGMMLRGKLGNQVFQIRNGKQVVAKMPKERTTPPSEKEIEHRQRFATLTQAINRLTPEQWEWLRGKWVADGYKYQGKTYCTLRGYAFARLNKEWM